MYEAPRPNKRSIRRHDNERLKRNRSSYRGGDVGSSPRLKGFYLNTPANCSCCMCGNERKYFKNRTYKEKLGFMILKKELKEMEDAE